MSNERVVGVVATFQRPAEIARLLDSLARSEIPLLAVVIVDNANTPAVADVASKPYPFAVHYHGSVENLGCGGGLRLAEERALARFSDELTHLWILDDDAVVEPTTLGTMLQAMRQESAGLAYPMVAGPDGRVGWLPGLDHPRRREWDRSNPTIEEVRSALAGKHVTLSWAQGIALLVTRKLVQDGGLHRDDFWVRGEDLEFSLRMTAQAPGIFVPETIVQHLPPDNHPSATGKAEFLKHCALLQNLAFIGLRLSYGHRIAWTVIGAFRRFLRVWGIGALGDGLLAVWNGAILGKTAGASHNSGFLARFRALESTHP